MDTHALVWFLTARDTLPRSVREIIEQDDSPIFVSPVSAYEIGLKFKKGKWPEVEAFAVDFAAICLEAGFVELPITLLDAMTAGKLELSHADPFDRLLAAQAIVNDMPILSIDRSLDRFNVRRIWG